jgi:ABC-type transport system involved in multi-copper enzyme maturation permease subunit
LEIRARKVFYIYWSVAFCLALIALIYPEIVGLIASEFFSKIFGFMILLMAFGSAGLIPSFVKKGRIELTLSKPIDRYRLILMKFFSVFIIMCAILSISMILLWLVLFIRTDFVSFDFFIGLLFSFAHFFAVYAVVAFLGLASNSAALAIIGYFLLRGVSFLLALREGFYQLIGESVLKNVIEVIYHILPKIGEMTDNYVPLMEGHGFIDTYPLYSTVCISVALILVMLLIFKYRDY